MQDKVMKEESLRKQKREVGREESGADGQREVETRRQKDKKATKISKSWLHVVLSINFPFLEYPEWAPVLCS